MEYQLKKLVEITNGWVNYFGIADGASKLANLDGWIRRRLRSCIWKQWKLVETKFKNLQILGIPKDKAWEFANTRKGYWRISKSPILSRSITNQRLEKRDFKSLVNRFMLFINSLEQPCCSFSSTAVYRTVRTVVWEVGG